MEICFNRTGADRKSLVAAISEITGTKAKYMGAPGFAFCVGGCTISSDGTLETGEMSGEDAAFLLTALEDRGFTASETPAIIAVNEEEPAAEERSEIAGDETAPPAAPVITIEDDFDGVLTIEWPADEYPDRLRDNLEKLVDGKAALIRKAIGVHLGKGMDHLPVYWADGRICFSWFRTEMGPAEIGAWSKFTSALLETAKKQKRVLVTEKDYDGSMKYAMRCFLLKLGFIGSDTKEARRIILKGLPGSGSHKTGDGKKLRLEPETDLYAARNVDELLEEGA